MLLAKLFIIELEMAKGYVTRSMARKIAKVSDNDPEKSKNFKDI
jgi:hypothetical protein